jgi:aldehyde:ferredoxin oxidoreductase
MNGFMGKLLRVNLSEKTLTEDPLRSDWARQYLGGAALATRYLLEETRPGIDPLSAENKLIFMTGPLTGTASASASRYSVVAKSPQTGLLGHSNSGGTFGPVLKRAGYDGIIFEGVSDEPVYLKIIDGEARLLPARDLWGKTVPKTEEEIQSGESRKLVMAVIGPAGENLVRYAAIINNQHRAAGRCGMGAVMGSKRLKAVVVAGKRAVPLAREAEFTKSARRQIDLLNESILKVGFDTFGTNMVSDMIDVRGGYPVRNWQEGTFEQIEDVNAQALTDKVLVDGVPCFACPIVCGRGTEIREGEWQGHKGEGPEYETVNTLGPLCGVSDLNAITMANYLCNHYGLDTISAGASIAFAMECFQKGLLTKDDTGGIQLNFGDVKLVVDLIEKIARRQGIGDLLAEGTRRMAEQIGGGSDHFAVNVKGLELPAYDPRAAKICGLGYVTANRGGDHMTAYVQGPTFIDMPFLIVEDSSIKDPFIADPAEARVVVDMEDALSVLDAVGGCKFMGILISAEDMVELIAAATGWDFDVAEFRRSGARIYNLMRTYCIREGVNRELDTLPRRLMEDPLPGGPAEGQLIEREALEEMKDAYYACRGWDPVSGAPSTDTLRELGMDKLVGMLSVG